MINNVILNTREKELNCPSVFTSPEKERSIRLCGGFDTLNK